MDFKHKIALVGAGKWGKKLLSELSKLSEVKYVVSTGNPETISFLMENYPSIQSVAEISEVLDDPEIEAVFVATPTETHHKIACQILNSGKHLFLEKPGGKNVDELREINEIAKSKGLTFAVGYEFIHHPVLKKIVELTKDTQISFIEMEWFKWGTFKDAIPAHLLSHEISIIKSLIKENISHTSPLELEVISKGDIYQIQFSTLNTKITSLINRVSPDKRKTVTMHTTENKTYIWNNNDLFTTDGDQMIKIETGSDSPVKMEIIDFFNSIEASSKPYANGDFSISVFEAVQNL